MAKRLTDSDKWKKPWFRKLPPNMKLVWFYLCDICDHRGVWDGDVGLMSYQIGVKFSREKILEYFSDRLIEIEPGKFFIKSFWVFQYKGKLNPSSNAHLGVISLLADLKDKGLISSTLAQPLPNPCPTLAQPLPNPCARVLEEEEEEDKAKNKNKALVMDKETEEDKAEGRGGVGEKPKGQTFSGRHPALEGLAWLRPIK